MRSPRRMYAPGPSFGAISRPRRAGAHLREPPLPGIELGAALAVLGVRDLARRATLLQPAPLNRWVVLGPGIAGPRAQVFLVVLERGHGGLAARVPLLEDLELAVWIACGCLPGVEHRVG